MFKEAINNLQIMSEDASVVFGQVTGGSYSGDSTFVATLRALLHNRMKDGEKLEVVNRNARSVNDVVSSFANTSNRLTIINVYGSIESNEKLFEEVDKAYGTNGFEGATGFVAISALSSYFKNAAICRFYANEVSKSAAILVSRLNLQRYHVLQQAIPTLLKWYFTGDNAIRNIETKTVLDDRAYRLMKCLNSKDGATEYTKIMDEYTADYDFEKMKIERLLNGIETKIDEYRLENATRRLEETRANIRRRQDEIRSYLSSLKSMQEDLVGIRSSYENAEERRGMLMGYFLSNRDLHLDKVTEDRYINFTVNCFVAVWDVDVYEPISNNPNSYLYTHHGGNYSHDDIKLLLDAIFIDKVIKLRTITGYSLDLAQGVETSDWNDAYSANSYPNPHHNHYSCLGSHYEAINEFMMRSDYIGVLDQCCAAAANFNFSDSTVMSQFVRDIFSGDFRTECFLLPSGEYVSVDAAIDYLKN